MPNSTMADASTSGARATSSAGSRSWRLPLRAALTVLLISTSTASCKLPGDLRALSRSTTALTETINKEIPPTMQAIRSCAKAIEGDAIERTHQTEAIGEQVNRLLGWIVSGAVIGVWLLRGIAARWAKRIVAKNGGGGPTPPPSEPSSRSSAGG